MYKLTSLLARPHTALVFEKVWKALKREGITEVTQDNRKTVEEVFEHIRSDYPISKQTFSVFVGFESEEDARQKVRLFE